MRWELFYRLTGISEKAVRMNVDQGAAQLALWSFTLFPNYPNWFKFSSK